MSSLSFHYSLSFFSAHIDWIRSILEEAISLAPPNFLRVLIYITDPKFNAPSPPSKPDQTNEKVLIQPLVKVSSADTLVLPTAEPFIPEDYLVLRSGRPSFPEILEEQINSTDYSDYFCCGTCGPSGMTTELANAISNEIHPKQVLKGEKRRNIVSRNYLETNKIFTDFLFFLVDSVSLYKNLDGNMYK